MISNNNKIIFLAVLIPVIFSSCATIFGGRKYNAHIQTNRPNARIYIDGEIVGSGNVKISVLRKNANKLHIVLKEQGCVDTQFNFVSRKIRPLALANVIAPYAVTFLAPSSFFSTYEVVNANSTVKTNSEGNLRLLILSFWLNASLVDLINFSSMYKPDVNEPGVYKINYKNYIYKLNSTCQLASSSENVDRSSFTAVVYLKNGNIIKGKIIEILPNISLKIQTIDGSILVYKFEDIEKYTQ